MLSFIVPVYNVEKYLRKCVESLINQDYSGYEIILVDDGSTDGSGELCDEIVRANDGMSRADALNEPLSLNDGKPQIRVVHQKNGGLSAARNAGLKVAKGEYVCFVDSDDYWEENVLGGLMEQVVRDGLDILRFDYQNVNEHYEVFEPNKTPRYIDKKNDVVDGVTYLNTRMGYACYAVMYIMRKAIVPTFIEGVHFEDVDWLPRMMLRAKRVNCTTTIVYNYLVRQGSITKVQGDKKKIRKNIEDRLYVIDKYLQYIEQYPQCRWLKNMQSSMTEGVLTTIMREFYNERKGYIKQLKEMNVSPLSIADQGKTYKRRATLINLLGANLYCIVMHICD